VGEYGEVGKVPSEDIRTATSALETELSLINTVELNHLTINTIINRRKS
jgi:hypothetical protein